MLPYQRQVRGLLGAGSLRRLTITLETRTLASVFGDTRRRGTNCGKTGFDFVVHTDDLATGDYRTAQRPVFFDIEPDLQRKTVFSPVPGDRERRAPASERAFRRCLIIGLTG